MTVPDHLSGVAVPPTVDSVRTRNPWPVSSLPAPVADTSSPPVTAGASDAAPGTGAPVGDPDGAGNVSGRTTFSIVVAGTVEAASIVEAESALLSLCPWSGDQAAAATLLCGVVLPDGGRAAAHIGHGAVTSPVAGPAGCDHDPAWPVCSRCCPCGECAAIRAAEPAAG